MRPPPTHTPTPFAGPAPCPPTPPLPLPPPAAPLLPDPAPRNDWLARHGLPPAVCRDAVNPGFSDPWDCRRDITFDHPKYRYFGMHLMTGAYRCTGTGSRALHTTASSGLVATQCTAGVAERVSGRAGVEE